MMRRIAILSMHTCPAAQPGGFKTGGMNVYIRELSHELGRRGLAVDVFTRHQDSCAVHLDQPFDETAAVRLIHLPAGPGVSVEPDALLPFVTDFAAGIKSFAVENAIQYDLIYSHYWLSGLAGLILREKWSIPLVQMFHTLGVMKDRIGGQPDNSGSTRNRAEAQIMAEADVLIAATSAEYSQMTLLYNAPAHRIRIVPPGVDTDRFYPVDAATRLTAKRQIGFADTDKVLLFVGRPEPLKAIDTILEAIQIAFSDDPTLRDTVRLLLIGGQRQEAAIQALMAQAETLGIGAEVCFLDAQPQDVLPTYYHGAEMLLMPSDYESFGMTALEAMACGTPVIASQVGGLAYMVHDGYTGLHIPTRDSDALATAIRQLLNSPDKREHLASQAAESARRYRWPNIVEQLLAIFETST